MTFRLTKAKLKIIEDAAAKGHSEQSIAKLINVHPKTLSRLKNTLEASNKTLCYFDVHGELTNKLENAILTGRTKGEEAAIDKLMSHVEKGSVASVIFLLKTRYGWRERDAQKSQEAPPPPPAVTVAPKPEVDATPDDLKEKAAK